MNQSHELHLKPVMKVFKVTFSVQMQLPILALKSIFQIASILFEYNRTKFNASWVVVQITQKCCDLLFFFPISFFF